MIAAIYARKSTAQDGVADEAKSVDRQIAGARTFIAARGWTLDETHIYKDEAKSGALFASRDDFQRMMRDAEAGAFNALVFYDLDRFGRNARLTMVALNTLVDLGIEIWDYSTGQSVDLESFEGEMLTFLKARFAQQFRDQIRKHTTAAMRRKAELGLVTGGRVFGYENVRIAKGHTELREHPTEAPVVRDIYARFAAGEGIRTIAAALNHAGVPTPKAQQRRSSGWSASTIRAVLARPLYRGEMVYGKTAKAYGRELGRQTTREKGQIRRPEETWTRVPKPELRIVDEDIIARVDERRHDRRTRYLASVQRADGRHPEKAHGKYLLSGGMLICPSCGGQFEARKYPWKGNPGSVYSCATRRRKPGICNNTLALPIAETDEAVLDIVEGEVLGTNIINELLALVEDAPDETTFLTATRDRLRGEISKMVDLFAAGLNDASVVPKIKEREAEVARIEAKLRLPRKERVDIAKLRAALEQRTEQWRADLRAEPKIARLLVRRLIGPLTLWDEPRPDFVRWEATPTPEALLVGLAPTLQVASPSGSEPVCTVEARGKIAA